MRTWKDKRRGDAAAQALSCQTNACVLRLRVTLNKSGTERRNPALSASCVGSACVLRASLCRHPRGIKVGRGFMGL